MTVFTVPPRAPEAARAVAEHTDSDPPALVGRRDWLFPCDDQLTAGRPLGEDDVAALLAALVARRDAVRAIGLPYVFAVAPMKACVYPELLPDGLVASGQARPVEVLSAALRDVNGCDVLDLLPALRDGRRHGALYFRTDTQWNARGAFLATRALLKEAAKRVPSIEPATIDGVNLVHTKGFRGDLADKPKVAFRDGDLVAIGGVDEAWTEEIDEVDVTTLRAQQMPAPAHLQLAGTRPPLLYEIAGADDLPRAVIVGDSCCLRLLPWLAERFRRLVFMQASEPPLEAVELEMPDVLIHVTTERSLLGRPA